MSTITILRPRISGSEAERLFSPGGLARLAQKAIRGPFRSMATMYVPFDVFRIVIQNGSARDECLLGVDAASGGLDPYRFEEIPGGADCVSVNTRNLLARNMSHEQSSAIAEERVRRMVYTRGFGRVRRLEFQTRLVLPDLYIPYWVGFFGPDNNLRVSVLDAVRGEREGGKARQLMRDFLISAPLSHRVEYPAHP